MVKTTDWKGETHMSVASLGPDFLSRCDLDDFLLEGFRLGRPIDSGGDIGKGDLDKGDLEKGPW